MKIIAVASERILQILQDAIEVFSILQDRLNIGIWAGLNFTTRLSGLSYLMKR